MGLAEILSRAAAELALFAGAGFLLFAVNDLLVDIIYFARGSWRSLTVYSRYPRAFASALPDNPDPAFIAMLVPAWDEAAVIASMLRATLGRLDYANYRIFVGHYRNDPATAAAIAAVDDGRVQAVEVDRDGPTTKADCLNHLYDALVAYEAETGRSAAAVALHDADVAAELARAIRILAPPHLVLVAGVQSGEIGALARREASDWPDPWIALAASEHEAQATAQRLLLKRLGAPVVAATPERLEQAVFTEYEALRRARRV